MMPNRGRGRGRNRVGARGRQSRVARSNRGSGNNAAPVEDNWWEGGAGGGKLDQDDTLDIDKDVTMFFVGVASFEKHLEAQKKNPTRYTAAIALLNKIGVEMSANSKVRSLTAAWARNDYDMAESLLSMRGTYGMVEVVKASTLLDTGRQIRCLEKKMRRLELSGTQVRKNKMSNLKKEIDNMTILRPSEGSVSGAFALSIRRWTRTLTTEELEFFALHMPKEPWKKLSDLVHFHPENDFPALPWFLRYCYGDTAPEGNTVNRASNITADNINSLLKEISLPFTHVREHLANLTDESKASIVRGEDKVDRGIWWYQELRCPLVDQAITERLQNGEEIQLNYGKLMERLLTFKLMNECPTFFELLLPKASAKLETTRLNLEGPIAVLADASASMDVAIRTATIIASLLSAFTTARLIFFNKSYWEMPHKPETIEQILDLAIKTKASECTSPAAALWPFYNSRQVYRTIIIVTDEEENTKYEGYSFSQLYKKYVDEIYPAALVFVSFLSNQTSEGQMVKELKTNGHNPMQFRLNGARPDLTKLDNILGQLSMQSSDFGEQLGKFETRIQNEGMATVFKDLFGEDSMVINN